MGKAKKLLQDCVGIGGYEKLEKAIYRRGSQSVADPLELYLPLLVVPRAILSWLVQNIQQLKIGEHKELPVPGKDGVILYIRKEDTDVYRGEFVEKGKIIHVFEKQSLPSIAGHMMTVFEEYGHLVEPQKEAATTLTDEPKGKFDLGMVKEIISLNELEPQADPETQKWMYAHENVKELTSVIGKLVDALVSRHIGCQDSFQALDAAVDKREVKETLEKPYISDAQRRWAHTDAGKKALGGEAAVRYWDKETKGKDLPEKVAKESTRENKTPSSLEEKVILNVNSSKRQLDSKSLRLLRKPSKYIAPTESNEKIEKVAMATEKPAGTALPKLPSPPKALTPKAAGANRAPTSGQAVKQPAVARAPSVSTKQPKPQSAAMAQMKVEVSEQASTYFRGKLAKIKKTVTKSEPTFLVTEKEVYNPCPHCGVPEFMEVNGQPKFKPCHCFMIMAKNEDGQSIPFVEISPKGNSYQLKFNSSVDSESVHAFLTNLKSRLLKQKGSSR